MEVWALVLLFSLIFQVVYCQSNSNSVLTSSTLRSATASKSGNVIISDDNTVYLLNGDLSEVIQMDRREGQSPEGQSPEEQSPGEQSPEGMTLTRDEDRLVVCWANRVTSGGQLVNTAPCSIYNSSTLDVLVNVTLPASTGVGAPARIRDRGNNYSVSRGFTGGSGETFFVMSGLFDSGATNRLYHREYSVSNGNFERQEVQDVEGLTSRTYHSGITVDNYTYIVADDVESSGGRVRVIRLCEGTNIWDSWYEIQLICGTVSGTLSDFGSELLDANFLTVEDGASEAMLLVTVKSESGSSDTCSFPLSSIDSTARGLLQYCQSNTVTPPFPWTSSGGTGDCGSDSITECDLSVSPGLPGIGDVGPERLSTQVANNPPSQIQPLHGETPLNSFSSTVLSSSEVFLVDGVVVMFAGLSTGEVRKYTAVNFTANEVDPSPECTWSLSSSVKSLTYSRGSDYVYAVTETTVYRLPVEECSNFTDCSSCTTSGGRLCGWCSVENKCIRSIQCANSSRFLRWIQDSGQCSTKSISVDLSQLDPTSMLVTTSRTSAISPTPPPTSPPLPTPSPVPMPTRCDRKAREFVNMRKCSAGVDIRTALILAQPLTTCEYQLFYSRFCQFQKCMDSLVDLLHICFSEAGLDKQNSSAILDNTIPLHSKLFCGWDRECKDFCGVMFPEFITLEPLTFNLTCAIQGSTCSSTCRMIVSSAINHYGCCLNQYLKLRLRVDVNRFYKRCGVTPPDRCRTKLKDVR